MVEHVLETMNEVITNDYSQEHQAVDIISGDASTSDIIALDSGIVEEVVKNVKHTDHSSYGNATYGNYVKIKQNNGKSALYAHMAYGSVNVNLGDYVEKGSIIGTMGQTGNAYGSHLHLEVKDESGLRENPIISLTTPSKGSELSINENSSDSDELENVSKTSESSFENEKTNDEYNISIDDDSSKKVSKRKKIEYLSNSSYNDGSIVDGLKEIGIDSSFDYREKLASKNGINDYRGSYQQNVLLLSLLKEGKLLKA